MSLSPQIIKACADGCFRDSNVQFGKFEVEVRDVCSRVERLISDGYLKRTKNNPQTVAYLPDPDAEEVTTQIGIPPGPHSLIPHPLSPIP